MDHKICKSLSENLQFSLPLQAYKIIIFVYKQVICQAKDRLWPDKKTVWSDKKKIKTNLRHFRIFNWLLLFHSTRHYSYLLDSSETKRWLRFSFRHLRSDCGSHWTCGKSLICKPKDAFSWIMIMRHKLVLQLDHRCIVFSRLQGFLRMYQTALACEAMKRSPAWTACQYKNSQ